MIPDPSPPKRPAVVLLVEDNPDHAFLTMEAFEDAAFALEVHHVEAGDHALAFLRRQPPYENAPVPDLVLLDIHMPRVNGYEVMEAISGDESLKSLLVVVLSTSSDLLDVDRMYKLGCRSYLNKPVSYDEFVQLVHQLSDYWFHTVVRPPHP